MGPGVEFDLVRAMLEAWGDAASGVGDDAAVLDVPPGERLVVSTDTAVEDVHFRREWVGMEEIGYRSAMAAMSDLAAMAARPLGLLVALTVPGERRDDVPALARGIGDAARRCAAPIVGGDLSAGRELSIAMTVLGTTAHPLSRGGARPGDRVFVTGVFGGPAGALRAWRDGDAPTEWSRQRFARPSARLREAVWLARHGASAMIDVSDGLASELRHLASASAVEVRVHLDRVPRGPGISLDDAMTGGEEYELLFSSGQVVDVDQFARQFGTPVTEIGDIRPSGHGVVVALRDGTRVDLAHGHDHYSA
jgi:thiamine-monophosphate kinase